MNKARKESALSLSNLSARLYRDGFSVAPYTIRLWELGTGEPRASMLWAIARILNRRVEYFMPLTDTRPEN